MYSFVGMKIKQDETLLTYMTHDFHFSTDVIQDKKKEKRLDTPQSSHFQEATFWTKGLKWHLGMKRGTYPH